MGLFKRLLGREDGKVLDNVDLSKMLETIEAYGVVLEADRRPVKPMHVLSDPRAWIRRSLAFCSSGAKIPRPAARAAYVASETFLPSPMAYPYLRLQVRIAEGGAKSLDVPEMRAFVEMGQGLNERMQARGREFDLLFKWYEGLVVHRYTEERRLGTAERAELKKLLADSIAMESEWFAASTPRVGVKGTRTIDVPAETTIDAVVKELNNVHRDMQVIAHTIAEIP
jgi:hypothetical protein